MTVKMMPASPMATPVPMRRCQAAVALLALAQLMLLAPGVLGLHQEPTRSTVEFGTRRTLEFDTLGKAVGKAVDVRGRKTSVRPAYLFGIIGCSSSCIKY